MISIPIARRVIFHVGARRLHCLTLSVRLLHVVFEYDDDFETIFGFVPVKYLIYEQLCHVEYLEEKQFEDLLLYIN